MIVMLTRIVEDFKVSFVTVNRLTFLIKSLQNKQEIRDLISCLF